MQTKDYLLRQKRVQHENGSHTTRIVVVIINGIVNGSISWLKIDAGMLQINISTDRNRRAGDAINGASDR